jgi:hypothetical protein
LAWASLRECGGDAAAVVDHSAGIKQHLRRAKNGGARAVGPRVESGRVEMPGWTADPAPPSWQHGPDTVWKRTPRGP